MNIEPFGKAIIGFGILLIIVGVIVTIGSKFGIGKLPGDIYLKRGNFSFYFPIVTSIIISIVLTIVLNLIARLK